MTNLLLESFQQQLLEARNELGFVEVRLLGVVSSAFIPRVLPTYEPYFQNLDKALGFLLKNGLVPFFELSKIPWDSSQPSALQPESSFVVKNNRYFELLEAFLAHCADAYPASWTDRWEFELWKSDKETPEDYVAAFGRIQELIRRYLPKVRFGGFGFPSGGSEEEFSKMLSLFQSAKLTPDFISASLSLQEAGDISWVSTDRDVFYSRAKALCEILKNQGADLPLYITEWNSVFLPNLPIQASCFQAAFVCRNSLILSQFASRSAYWLFSPSPLLSGLVQKSMAFWEQGLVTRDGLKTPAYRAFQFLHMLGNTLIRKGDNFCVVKSGASHFQVLAFHYVHFSSSPGKLRDLSFQNTYQLFENTLILDFSMSLSDLAPGTYRIHRILLDRANGSALDLWIGGFASSSIDQREYLSNIALPNREQLDYLKNACVPELRTIYLDVKDTLTVRTSLQPHTVCLWDIQHLI